MAGIRVLLTTRRTICRACLGRLITAGLPKAGYGAIVRNFGGFNEREDRGSGQTGIRYLSMALGVALLNCDYSKRSEKDEALFLKAVKSGDLYKVKSLINSSVEVGVRHKLGWTGLHAATINGDLDLVKVLVEAGADVNVKDEFSSSQRIAAGRKAHHSQVAELRDREFCSWINHYTNYSGFTPLHYAIIADREEIVRYLLDKGADPSIQNSLGHTPSDYCTNHAIKELLDKATEKVKEKQLEQALEERRRFPLEDRLRQHIVGQEGAMATVAGAIRRKEMGWGDSEHPLVLLFLGSSGIGKTELAKQVANYIHKDNPKGFIRIDMSEYQQKHEVAKLIGAPPGYVGYEQGGQLTARLKECPNAVVLFDEVDKAHPDVLTVLLQLFDEGRLTDGQGNTVECKDAIFVMTSNLASDEIADHALKLRREAKQVLQEYRSSKEQDQEGIEVSREFKESVVEPILKYHFKRDEFLGRINEMVYFLPFSRGELHQLVKQELQSWSIKAKARHNITLTWDSEVEDVLADGYNVKYGARSIHHEVERRAVNVLALAFERGHITKGSSVHLVVSNGNRGAPSITIQSNDQLPIKGTDSKLITSTTNSYY